MKHALSRILDLILLIYFFLCIYIIFTGGFFLKIHGVSLTATSLAKPSIILAAAFLVKVFLADFQLEFEKNIVLFYFSVIFVLFFAEGFLRIYDGYQLFSMKLTRTESAPSVGLDYIGEEGPPIDNSEPFFVENKIYSLQKFIDEFDSSDSVREEWISRDPPIAHLDRKVLEKHRKRFGAAGKRAVGNGMNHVFNDYFIRKESQKPSGGFLNNFPLKEIYLFSAPWETEFPSYRYEKNVRLPDGLRTNNFGWRGPNLSLNKPKNTIRIACVGASTTASHHSYKWSYPEFVQTWLNLWSLERGYNIQFEVLNAGRYGISSSHIAAVVKYELLPMEVDFVIYYEGVNRFPLNEAVILLEETQRSQLSVFREHKWLRQDVSNEYSALIRRMLAISSYLYSGSEVPKPKTKFVVPEALSEDDPTINWIKYMPGMKPVVKDLTAIKANLENQGAKFILSTFVWCIYDGIYFDPNRHRRLWREANTKYWPLSYRDIEKGARLQNNIFKHWALRENVFLIDVDALMPKEPDLFFDLFHNSPLGVRVRAWITFNELIPLLESEIKKGVLPRPDKVPLKAHPFMMPSYVGLIENGKLIARSGLH